MGKSVAILGASTDRGKYGNKAVRAYLKDGWEVYPVNPRAAEIEGLPAFHSLADLPGPVDRISVYLPPEVGIHLLPEIAQAPHKELYFNPGSESPELVEKARAAGLKPIQACSIVSIGRHPDQFPGE